MAVGFENTSRRLGYLRVDEIILKRVLRKLSVKLQIGFRLPQYWIQWRTIMNMALNLVVSWKGEEFLDLPKDYWLLKQSASWCLGWDRETPRLLLDVYVHKSVDFVVISCTCVTGILLGLRSAFDATLRMSWDSVWTEFVIAKQGIRIFRTPIFAETCAVCFCTFSWN